MGTCFTAVGCKALGTGRRSLCDEFSGAAMGIARWTGAGEGFLVALTVGWAANCFTWCADSSGYIIVCDLSTAIC